MNNILKRSRTSLEFRKVACLGLAYVPRLILLKSTILLLYFLDLTESQLSSQMSTHAKHTKEAYNQALYHIQYPKSNLYLGRQTLLKLNIKMHIKAFCKQNSFWLFRKCGANTRSCILVKQQHNLIPEMCYENAWIYVTKPTGLIYPRFCIKIYIFGAFLEKQNI